MNTSFIYNNFYPSKDILDSCSIREKEQLTLLIGANLVFMVLFALFGIVLFLFKYVIIGLGGIFLLAFFATSLAFIKKGHIHKGSWVTTIAIVLLTATECFGTPFTNSNFLPYRDSCFIAVMSICNYVVSLRRKQLHSFSSLIIAIWIVSIFINYTPLFNTNPNSALMNIIICSLAIITTEVCLLLFDRFTRKVLEHAQENEHQSAKAFEKISAVINETKEGLDIGKQLSASTATATDSVEEIRNLYNFINQESVELSREALTIKDSSLQINDKADMMKQSVQNQSNAISQTSAALTQMSASLTNISNIATQQRAGMNNLITELDSQMTLLQKLVNDVTQVKVSSQKVSAFVESVNKIASQTGLLAMNASIEAAHAGKLGQGFSVIAQEIRKLSEQTTTNAQKIAETLNENEAVVNVTTDSMTSFSAYTQTTTEQIRNTISVIEEILTGISEIDAGTRDVTNAINQIVGDADTNTHLAEGVASEIIQQNSALEKISNGTEELQTKVSSLDRLLENIKNAIREIEKHATENEVVSAKISGALN